MRAPEQPSGWPSAMAPPSALTRSSSSLRRRITARACDGERLVELDRVEVADAPAGPGQGLLGGRHRAEAHEVRLAPRRVAEVTMRARGVRPYRSTAAALATTRAAAPSDSGEEVPAVTTPPARKTGAQRAQLLQRGGRGAGPRRGSPRRPSPAPGRSPRSKRPASIAATARWWLRSAKASLSARVMPSRAATSSAVSPIARVTRRSRAVPALVGAAKRGLVKRQPSEVSSDLAGPGPRRAGLGHHPGRAGHRLDAAGDDQVGLAGSDRLGGRGDGGQAARRRAG